MTQRPRILGQDQVLATQTKHLPVGFIAVKLARNCLVNGQTQRIPRWERMRLQEYAAVRRFLTEANLN